MNSARMVRATKSKLVLYVFAALFLCGLTFLFHNSQTKLDDTKQLLSHCNQQTESLSAQLQVIFEYKLRLEKSLQKERAELKDTREQFQQKALEQKQIYDKETLEANNRFSALKQHFNILETNHKGLEEECSKIRKVKLAKEEDISLLENQLSSLRQELQQVKEENNKTIQGYKLQLENIQSLDQDDKQKDITVNELNKILEENAKLKEELELAHAKGLLNESKNKSSTKPTSNGEIKGIQAVNLAGPGLDNPNNIPVVAAEPPKVFSSGSSTTPVINPDAVIDHDDPAKQGQKELYSKSSTSPSLIPKPTQGAAAPLVIPQHSNGSILMQPAEANQDDNTHQLAPPENMQKIPPKPVEQINPVGPMNPIQNDARNLFIPAVEINGNRMSNENNLNNLLDPHGLQDLNGAVEEMEEAQPRQDNEIPRPVRPHDYQGGDYDKEEEEEGEQMDYDGKQQPPPALQNHLQPRFYHRQGAGGSIMVNPK